MNETDGDGLDRLGLELLFDTPQIGFIQRHQDGAVGRNPLVDLETEIAFDQNLGFVEKHVVDLGSPDAAQLQHVPEALGGDQGRLGAPMLQDGVGGHRGSVSDLSHGGTAGFALAQKTRAGKQDRLLEVGGVDGTFWLQILPSASSRITSVNVPPTSAPIRMCPCCSLIVG